MTSQNLLSFSNSDYLDFRDWIKLNLDGLTWQGRYEKEFEEFWNILFQDGLTLKQVFDRFNYILLNTNTGPLSTWFYWLRDKFLCYVFIKKDIDIYSLSLGSGLHISYIATTLRNFFIEFFPYLDEYFSESFQIGNVASENLNLTMDEIVNKVGIEREFDGSHEDDVMPAMEVTLYDDWMKLIEKAKRDFYKPKFDLKKISAKTSLKQQLKFLQDVALLMGLGGILIFAIYKVNFVYEKYLEDKISVYEPQFKWLNKTLTFKKLDEDKNEANFKLNPEDIEQVEDKATTAFENTEEERYSTESEVVLTSWDSLPKDFSVADLEKSDYEELIQRGYRDSRYGHTKVYRLMMKSVDINKTRKELNGLLDKYGVTQVDNVRPGQNVPGGIYYNLFVPRPFLKEFVAQVMEVDEATLFESRTRSGRNPPGKNKVFIWVKSL